MFFLQTYCLFSVLDVFKSVFVIFVFGLHKFFQGNRGHTYLGDPENRKQIYPDYVAVCNSFNVPAEQVMFRRDLRAALQRMLDSKTAYVLNVMTPYAEHVLPFIPAGRTVADMKW